MSYEGCGTELCGVQKSSVPHTHLGQEQGESRRISFVQVLKDEPHHSRQREQQEQDLVGAH